MNIKIQIIFKANGKYLAEYNKNICCVEDDDRQYIVGRLK